MAVPLFHAECFTKETGRKLQRPRHAKWNGWCVGCGRKIKAGDAIGWKRLAVPAPGWEQEHDHWPGDKMWRFGPLGDETEYTFTSLGTWERTGRK